MSSLVLNYPSELTGKHKRLDALGDVDIRGWGGGWGDRAERWGKGGPVLLSRVVQGFLENRKYKR